MESTTPTAQLQPEPLYPPPPVMAALAPKKSALAIVALVVRTRFEERVLREGLPGYDEYTHRVHYRLLPGVW